MYIKPKREGIEVGEEVLSYDEETGMQGYKPVVRLYRNVTEEWYHIHVNGEELRCTAEHPFYVVDKGFVPARGIHSLDKVLQSDGRYGIIETVEIERLTYPEATYNFEVAEYHTYYVGSGILTHNKCNIDAVINETLEGATNKTGNMLSKYKLSPDDALVAGEKFLGKGYV